MLSVLTVREFGLKRVTGIRPLYLSRTVLDPPAEIRAKASS